MKRCKHFGACGGCTSQDVPYEEQLNDKQRKVEGLFQALNPVEIGRILPSPEQFYYRNKMEFTFDRFSKEPRVGLRMKGRYDKIVDLQECLIFSEAAGTILQSAREWAAGLDRETPRFLVVRESKNDGTFMINLILKATKYVFENELRKKCIEFGGMLEYRGVKTGCLTAGLNRGKAEVAAAEENFILSKNDYIEEGLGGLKFRIFPYTFFQTNSRGTEVLYGVIKSMVSPAPDSTCLDVYCGSGPIGIWVSPCFEKVIGVEQNPLSIENARINARLNGADKCDFVGERAEIFLDKLAASKFHVKLSTVITDPPRPGLADRALKSIIELNPPEIIYVSCKPETMFDDLKKMIQLYKIEKIQPVDMFPNTNHVELVARLVHK